MGGMMPIRRKLTTGLWAILGAAALAGALVSFNPAIMLLIYPGLEIHSPYCSRWQAVKDFGARQKQQQAEKSIRASLQLVRRDGPLELWKTNRGSWWIPAKSEATLVVLLAQQERQIYGGVVAGETIIDCGAHVGSYVGYALRGGAGRVVAVEPSEDSTECLRRNFEKEIASGRVILVKKGIWDQEQELTFYVNGNGDAANSFVVHGGASRAVTMPVTTIDRLVEELKLERIGLIKADVKGATQRLLAGAVRTLGRDHPRLAFSTEEAPEDPGAITSLVSRLQPSYRATCGPCLASEDHHIRTDVMFYQ